MTRAQVIAVVAGQQLAGAPANEGLTLNDYFRVSTELAEQLVNHLERKGYELNEEVH